MTTSVSARAAATRGWLAEQYILADNDWLIGCVEYLCGEGETHTQQEINELAREQWLLNDLKDVCGGSLPPGLHAQHNTVLPGRYVLQVNCTLDVGTPAYQQYQKLKKINNENIEETTRHEDKIPNHRMIKLYLTDGVQDIFGIEYRTMRNLTCDITPGCKLLLKGPVACRRGMLLLQEHNVEMLGGEVEDLALENNLAAVFSRLLGVQNVRTENMAQLPSAIQNPLPPIEQPGFQRPVEAFSNNVASTVNRTQSDVTGARGRPTGTSFDRSAINVYDQASHVSFGRPVARVTGIPVSDNISDDDIDLDEIAAIEEQINKQGSNKRPLWTDNNCDKTNTNLGKKLKMQNAPTENRVNEFPTDEDFFEDDMDYLNEMEMTRSDNFNSKPSTSTIGNAVTDSKMPIRFPIEVPADPFVYIKQIKEMDEVSRIGKVFRIKAQIMKLLSKLSLGKDGWSLKVTLIDGSGTLDADFTSEVLGKLVGISAIEMTGMKKEMGKKPEVKLRAMEALNAARQNLQVLNCIIEITYLGSPTVTQLIPFTEVQARMLMSRLAATNL